MVCIPCNIHNEWMLKIILKYTYLQRYISSEVYQCSFFQYILVVWNLCVRNKLIPGLKRVTEEKFTKVSYIWSLWQRKLLSTESLEQHTEWNIATFASSDAYSLCVQTSSRLQVWSWTKLTFGLEEIHIFFNTVALRDQKSVCHRLFSNTDWISLIWLWSQGEFNSLLLRKLNYFHSTCRWITLPELCPEVVLKR